jgi:hypothetical protein
MLLKDVSAMLIKVIVECFFHLVYFLRQILVVIPDVAKHLQRQLEHLTNILGLMTAVTTVFASELLKNLFKEYFFFAVLQAEPLAHLV